MIKKPRVAHQPRLLRTSTVLMICRAIGSDSFFTNRHHQPCPRPGPSEGNTSHGRRHSQARQQKNNAKETATSPRRTSGTSTRRQQSRDPMVHTEGVRDQFPTQEGKGNTQQDQRTDNIMKQEKDLGQVPGTHGSPVNTEQCTHTRGTKNQR